ncbi:hypothetical protein OAL01_03480 [Rubripirellula sp.]|nr:hypothetical protein [Rubripirellula sp.]
MLSSEARGNRRGITLGFVLGSDTCLARHTCLPIAPRILPHALNIQRLSNLAFFTMPSKIQRWQSVRQSLRILKTLPNS